MNLSLPRVRGLRGLGSDDAAYNQLVAIFAQRAVSPADFQKARPGRSFPDPVTCLKIQCGAISQAEAGMDLLADCSFAGFAGAMSCADPLCTPYCGNQASQVSRAAQPLPVGARVGQRFLDGPTPGCNPIFSGPNFGGPYSDSSCGCEFSDFVNDHPFVAVALLAVGGYAIWRGRR